MPRYIDADAAVKRFEEMHGNESELLNCYNADWVISFIETQPTADVQEVKHGQWLRTVPSTSKSYRRICSECKQIAIMISKEYKCCPYCGAKMGVDEND